MSAMTIPDDATLATLRREAAGGEAEACFRLASALVLRQEVEQALELHAGAARAGHAGAQIEYARMLLYGIATDPDPRAAVHWFERAEQAGHVAAGYLLAMIALGGIALPRDGRINERLLRAVQANFPPALLAAAVHFGRKRTEEDQTACLQLLERAAARGDTVSAALLAERLAHGEGCEPQPDAAHDMRTRLAAHGCPALPDFTVPLPRQPASPPRQLALEDVLQMPPQQQLSEHPRVGIVDGLLSADECRLLIATATPNLQASQTVDPKTGLPIVRPLRTSSDASFDPIVESLALRLVQMRMTTAAGTELRHAEQLTVLRYAPGQQYRPHRDYLPPGTVERDHPQAGNRMRTICTYLNPVEAGGETEFPVARLKVAPEPGRAVIFDNLHTDGTPDHDSLHAGLPVGRGEKWLATLWLRQRPYRGF